MPSMRIMKQMASAILTVLFIVCLINNTISAAYAETYVFDGSARSQTRITQTTTIHVTGLNPATIPNGSKIYYNASYPSSLGSGGYSIGASNIQIDANPAPSSISGVRVDAYGNRYKQLVWDINSGTSSSLDLVVTTRFDADVAADLSPVSYEDAIGTDAYPEYRSPTSMVQSTAPAIVNKKNILLSGVTTEAEAVDKVIDFVKTSVPDQDSNAPKDALSSLSSSKGNCVSRAHLAIALLRSAGIPARCVGGLLYDNKYTVSYNIDSGTATTEIGWGEGSHVWIEVYYPDEGVWVPYDPYMIKGFVDTRHIKYAVSSDHDVDTSTRGDAGLLFVKGANATVTFDTDVSSSGLKDSISMHYRYTKQSPPHGTLMIAREMHLSTAPTLTPTPTVKPNNTTATPTVTASAGPTFVPSFSPDDYAKHNVSGAIVDASTGMAVQGATVLLDTIRISASDAGKFAFLYAVTNNSYVLTVSAPGYMTEKQVLMPNNADMDVKVKLVSLSNTSTSPTPTAKASPGPDILMALAALAGGMMLWGKREL